jgi:hypothetical protein
MAAAAAIYFRERFAYDTSMSIISMLIIVLKLLYILFLVVFVYFDIAFTAVASFLKVTFFGL